jgi:hypothetical protein
MPLPAELGAETAHERSNDLLTSGGCVFVGQRAIVGLEDQPQSHRDLAGSNTFGIREHVEDVDLTQKITAGIPRCGKERGSLDTVIDNHCDVLPHRWEGREAFKT